MVCPHGFEDAEHAHGIDIGRELRGVEADLHMALGSQVVYLSRLHQADELDEGHRVAHVGVMKMEMRLALQMGDTFAEVDRGTADDAVHLVAFLEKKLAKVRTVLSRHSRYQGDVFHLLYKLFRYDVIML